MHGMSVKEKLHDIVFNTNCKFGQAFDFVIIILILISTVIVSLASVEQYNISYSQIFNILEWILTIFFTIEYILRLYASERRLHYMFSFFGILRYKFI